MLTLLIAYLRDGGSAYTLGTQPGETSADHRRRIALTLLDRYLPACVRASNYYSTEQVQRWAAALARNLHDGVDIRLEDAWRIGGRVRVYALHVVTQLAVGLGWPFLLAVSVHDWDARALLSRILYSAVNLPNIARSGNLEDLDWSIVWAVLIVMVVLSQLDELGGDSYEPEHFTGIDFTRLLTARGVGRVLLHFAVWFTLFLGIVYAFVTVFMSSLTFVGFFGDFPDVLPDGLDLKLKVALFAGLMAGFNAALEEGLANHDVTELTPSTRIYGSLLSAIMLGIFGGLTLWVLAGPYIGLAGGVTIAFMGPSLWLRYVIGVTVASARGKIPLRLIPFLEWGIREGLLRRSGTAYQFRHLNLRDRVLLLSRLPSSS